ncbi:PH domain-containing protein [Streptomyces sp. NPDC051561]|uniref:PH domain-containing protein n=1 Tax=Streptomyces sp. NPDC051561 TaxID=3365658 RepID=UPI003795472E
MSDVRNVSLRPRGVRALWCCVALGACGAVLAAVRMAYFGRTVDAWAGAGLLLALVGLGCLLGVSARVSADASGLHVRRLLRRRSVPWPDIADLHVHLRHGRHGEERKRVRVVLRDGHRRRLPLPRQWSNDDSAGFDAGLDGLRALHRRYGSPRSGHLPVVTSRSAGHGPARPLAAGVLLLVCAGLAGWLTPVAEEQARAWRTAVPCVAGTPTAGRGECLTTLRAVIARPEAQSGKKSSWLYFAGGVPQERLSVSHEGAAGFRAGDGVELTLWRGQVRVVAGEHHVWREHFSVGGEAAVATALCVLAAGYPGALLLMRVRGRLLPHDEVLPSAVPFAGALAGTALWLAPLCYFQVSAPLGTPVTSAWAVAGAGVSAVLFGWAWRATRLRTPGEAAGGRAAPADSTGEVFLAARFLESVDYSPYGSGTHIVLGGGPPATTPHPGPGRFAAKRIPVERLTVKEVRRQRGGDGETVPRNWHIAELDDAGTPVRLAAAPADLARILAELNLGTAPAPGSAPAPAPADAAADAR